MFVDISGFTKLSEHLARRGRIGAEELAESIGSCFTELLAVAYRFGGDLLKFGGDAMFLLFRAPGHEARACAAAVGMRRTLRTAGRLQVPGMRLSLRMSIGVETGIFHVFLVGSSHRELIVTGPGATAVVALEAAADAGEIVVGERTAAALRPSLLGPAKGPGHLLRRSPTVPSAPARVYGPRTADVSAGIPVGLRAHLLTEDHQPEHRLVSIAFIHYDGTDAVIASHGPEAAAARLDRLVSAVQAAADHRHVTFLGTDVDHDGGKIILAAGAPSSSGDDERRLLLALREVLDTPLELPVRIGVNRGAVFAGDVGAPYRRTYTVMGDAVNLAARLMAKASAGELLTTRDVVARSATRFETSAVEPFYVKGKEHPVEAVSVGAVAAATPVEQPAADQFVGREAELETLLAAGEAARGGRGAVVEILGEPGLGKSRLLDELRRRAPGLAHQTVVCDSYESATPYFPFRRWLRALLAIGQGRSAVDAAGDLEDVIARLAPDLSPWAPLVASVMDIPMPDTPETAQLELRFRSARVGSAIGDLLARRLAEPTLIVVEDAHWMDEASAELVRHLAGRPRSTFPGCCASPLATSFPASRTRVAT